MCLTLSRLCFYIWNVIPAQNKKERKLVTRYVGTTTASMRLLISNKLMPDSQEQ